MKTILAAALLTLISFPASAQVLDCTGGEKAYKKLQQHITAGECREQTVNRGLDGATDKGRTARRAEQAARAK